MQLTLTLTHLIRRCSESANAACFPAQETPFDSLTRETSRTDSRDSRKRKGDAGVNSTCSEMDMFSNDASTRADDYKGHLHRAFCLNHGHTLLSLAAGKRLQK